MTTKKSEILIAIHAIMKEVGYVQKTDRNEFHKYNYAGEAALLEALRPTMLEYGLILIPSGQNIAEIDSHGNTHVAIDYTLAHVSGEVWPEKIRAYGCGNDRSSKGTVGDKGLYKALTGANKYLLFKLFQVETGDDPEKDKGDTEVKTTGKENSPADPIEHQGNKAIIIQHFAERSINTEARQRNVLRKYAASCELKDPNNIQSVEALTDREADTITSYIEEVINVAPC